ncbi:hypothetical protein GCM10009836_70590 [Pseudonocardia ailaonensis]|uniref:FG-GAP repeat protein n=1 Tax=Pseudonocardia ailaonensis TaxID=367279 RepID=A0ABN2NNZ5_9PSEU
MAEPEWVPGDPDGPVVRVGIGPADLDTDGDGVADTVAVAEGPDLLLHTDLDGDGLADRVLRLGPASFDRGTDDAVAGPGTGVVWWAPWTWFSA